MKIGTKITLLSFLLVTLSLMLGSLLLIKSFHRYFEEEMGSRALAIARTLAQMDQIRENVGVPGGENVIQPIAERTRLATSVDYVVVLDMEKRRYSHPLQELIGQKFTGGDEAPAFAEHEYISRAAGTLGPSVRAFVPVMDSERVRQVGVVVVGVLTPTVSKLLHHFRIRLYISLLAGLAVGILGSLFLAANIKRTMFNMEPDEIARLLEERSAVFGAICDGIIAIDRANRITVMNEEAKRIIGIAGDPVGRPIEEVIPDSRLPATIKTGQAVYNQERLINDTTIISNRIPIIVDGRIVGAVATFKDKTEVQALAEELTGVKKFVEALRVQTHEHMNTLHTIAGLIQLGKHDEAVDFIFNVTEEQEGISRFLISQIRDASVAGLLLGKYNRAKELKIEMVINRDSRLARLPAGMESSSLVIIIGNLLENAMEAVKGLEAGRRKVYCSVIQHGGVITIAVKDAGEGIPEEMQERVFEPGFSTKNQRNAGFGLALVKGHVEMMGGSITLNSRPGYGTEFLVELPEKASSPKGGLDHGNYHYADR